MKFGTENKEVEASGAFESSGFTFAASAKAFKIFIDGIYSDKIRAIVREIFTNAYDAHILAKKTDVAFVCHLPSVLEPHFSVRDFGPAIAHEDMLKRFTRVFDSTKDQSDDFVGSLGLGRLSPFAYTDNFTVITRIAGVKRTYAVYMNESSIPELSLMNTEDSAEEDGFEVIVPVDHHDNQAFWRAAEFTCIGFEPKPLCGDNFTAPVAKLSSDKWSIYPYLSGVHAKQGCVLYPIDTKIFDDEYDTVFSINGLVLDFPIGSLEFNASREALGYTAKTKGNIEAALDAYLAALTEKLQTEMEKCRTVCEAAELMSTFRNLYPQKILSSITWLGRSIRSFVEISNDANKKHGLLMTNVSIKRNQRAFRTKYSSKTHVHLGKDTTVYIIRTDKKILGVSNRICADVAAKFASSYEKNITVALADGPRAQARAMRYAAGGNVFLVEDLERPKTEREYLAKQRNMVSVQLFSYEAKSDYLSSVMEDIDVTVPGVYLVRDYNVMRGHFGKSGVTAIFRAAKKYNVQVPADLDLLISITPSQEERFKRRGWVEADTVLRELCAEIVKAIPNVGEYAHAFSLSYHDIQSRWGAFSGFGSILDHFGNKHPITRGYSIEVEVKKQYRAMSDQRYSLSSILRIGGAVAKPSILEELYTEALTELHTKFPMVSFVDSVNPSHPNLKILLDYLDTEEYRDDQEIEIQEAA